MFKKFLLLSMMLAAVVLSVNNCSLDSMGKNDALASHEGLVVTAPGTTAENGGVARAVAAYPSSYYASAAGKTGTALKQALHSIIRNHVKVSYAAVWPALKVLDQDPANSSNVILIYTRRSQSKTTSQEYGNSSDYWNREHLWPKSQSFDHESWPPYTDLHHLRPSDASVNSARGNKDFDNGGTRHSEATLCFTDSNSWEPPAEVKGDIARTLFYMAVRYEGDVSNEPDLELVEDPDATNSGSPTLARLSTLKQWNSQDPVSSAETRRNDLIYSNYQGNRNPFVDHPEYVNLIW